MKIGLGTVQWGLDYGIANTHGIPSDEVLNSIFALANKAGINLFDTAVQYGEAEKRLGQFSNPEHRIVTKIGNFTPQNSLKIQLENSFKHLKREKIYGCLFHNIEELTKNNDLWTELLDYKAAGKISKIGYSLYEPQDLLDLLEAGLHPDLIQLPYSILDRKFEPYFEQLKSLGTEIHIRSVFLQGLYFKPMEALSSKFNDLKSALKEVEEIATEFGLTKVELALNYVLKNEYVDYAIIGVEQSSQLKEIINASKIDFSKSIEEQLNALSVENPTLLNPSNWK